MNGGIRGIDGLLVGEEPALAGLDGFEPSEWEKCDETAMTIAARYPFFASRDVQ
jgi:hypothetical protein